MVISIKGTVLKLNCGCYIEDVLSAMDVRMSGTKVFHLGLSAFKKKSSIAERFRCLTTSILKWMLKSRLLVQYNILLPKCSNSSVNHITKESDHLAYC